MQHDRLTQAELDRMPAKTKKSQTVMDLYLQNDFLTAYAKHTDFRVDLSPEGAIGSHLEWESHGDIQLQFLISQGMRPEHRLLDIGCGTGRLARKAAAYLDDSNYYGVDLSRKAIDYAVQLAVTEGWVDKSPWLVCSRDVLVLAGQFDFIWAFSVFIHLPEWAIQDVCKKTAALMHRNSKFLFSYVPEKVSERTGLKQFRATLEVYRDAVTSAGMTFKEVKWPAQQHIALAMLV